MVGGGGGDLLPIDEGILKALKAWDSMFGEISGKADEIRDKILSWFGLNPDGTVLDPKRWEMVQTIVKGIGVAILAWFGAKTLTGLASLLGLMTKAQAATVAFGLTLAVTGLYFDYMGKKNLIDGTGDLSDFLMVIGGKAASTLGIASILKALMADGKLSWGRALVISFGITLALSGIQSLGDGIKTGNIKEAIVGAVETAVGTIWVPISIGIKSFGGGVAGIKGLANALNGLNAGKHAAEINTLGGALGTLAGKAAMAAGGIAGIAAMTAGGYNNMKNYAEGTQNTAQSMLGLTASIGGAAGAGALLGTAVLPRCWNRNRCGCRCGNSIWWKYGRFTPRNERYKNFRRGT